MTLRLEGGFLCISRATRMTFGCLNCRFELEAVIVLAKYFNFSVLDKSLFWKILSWIIVRYSVIPSFLCFICQVNEFEWNKVLRLESVLRLEFV